MVSPESSAQSRSPGEGRDRVEPANGFAGGFGGAIRARRRSLRLTLGDVAERAACAKSYLSALENGRRSPPSEAVTRRLEEALSIEPGALVRLAHAGKMPTEVRRDIETLRARDRSARSLARLLANRASGGGSLDQMFKSGELQSLIERLDPSPDAAESIASALPSEIPLINNVAAGYPADFTDLGYPARVADEYVRAPDVRDPDAFAARVVGDSMAPDYRAGDIVVFSPLADVRSGMDCFVRFEPDHDTTFKRVYFEHGDDGAEMIRIQPINNKYPANTVPREAIAGLYAGVSVIRKIGPAE